MKKRLGIIGGVLLAAVLAMVLSMVSVFAQDSYTPLDGDNAKIPIPVRTTLNTHDAGIYPAHTVTYKVQDGKSYDQSPQVNVSASSVTQIQYSFNGSTDVEQSGSSFDFSGVKFPKPGLYKFEITQTISSTYITPESGSETNYYVYVQVDNDNTATGNSELTYAPTSYKLVKGSVTQAPDGDPAGTDKVTEALFKNEFANKTIKIKKETTGNQGDKSREFEIGVQLGGIPFTHNYNINLVSGTPKVGTTTITADIPYKATASGWTYIKLKDGDEVLVTGIPEAAQITVQEKQFGEDGYTSTSSVDNGTPSAANDYTVKTDDLDDHRIVYINKKEGTIPTGIFINNWPYIAMVLVVAAAAAVFVSRRNRKLEDEDL